ncbi:MAG: BlaI/MecI/CopY family transcriptional regulator [Clostridiales bacterium]|jgi:predicted transcriptional regulator|nr:BlaI/MecI/CopY family transcriptional regulator [Clostridiales bacterium]
MEHLKLYDAEYRFACVIWDNEPVHSRKLTELCAERLGWKRSTTYTVLRKLCNRNILANNNAIVTALVKKQDVLRYESDAFIERAFNGSLPSFITTFLRDKTISKQEAQEIQDLINKYAESKQQLTKDYNSKDFH